MTGCWEHTSLIWAPLKDTRSKGRSLSIIWLDLANSYRSVPQVLILFALSRYKIPEDWVTLVITFYNRHWGRGGGGGGGGGSASEVFPLTDTDVKKGYLHDATYLWSCHLQYVTWFWSTPQ